jgi:PIN domain nuclease of toxin-antitoxin system
VILLDTNALIWLQQGHRRGRPLQPLRRVYISPASLLELQFLSEAGRIRFASGASVSAVALDPRWAVDDPPSGRWFLASCEIGWTRDPFDRLIVAHALLRGWKLATADEPILSALGPSRTVRL